MYLIAGVFYGLTFFDVGSRTSSLAGVNSIFGLFFQLSSFAGVMFCMGNLPYNFGQRAVFAREAAAGMYSRWAFGLAQVFPDWPHVFLCTLLFVTPVYWLTGLTPKFLNFLQYFLTYLVMMWSFGYLAQMSAAILPNVVIGSVLQNLLCHLFNLSAGLFIFYTDLPDWWRWFWYINPFSHTVQGLMITHFDCDIDSGDCPVIEIPDRGSLYVHDYVRESFNLEFDRFWDYLGWTAGLGACFLVIGILGLRFLNFQRR